MTSRRSFIGGILASAALATGLARTKLDILDGDNMVWCGDVSIDIDSGGVFVATHSFFVGASDESYMVWDGEDLTIKGDS